MARKGKGEKFQTPEVFITRGLLYPEQLDSTFEQIARGLGARAILFSPDELAIPLFKASALPNIKYVNTKQSFDDFIDMIEEAVSHKEPEITVPIYKNSLPTLFTIDATADIGIRLRNNYPKVLFEESKTDIVPETVHDQFAGGQVDFMVHVAVETLRSLFPENPVGPDHRGYINGRDNRMRAQEIFDYVKIGTTNEEYFSADPGGLRAMLLNPELVIREQELDLEFPTQLTFGAMEVVVRDRKVARLILN